MPTFNNTTAAAIPDNDTIASTIEVSGVAGTIADLNLTTFITHTWNEDLDIFLRSPTGTQVEITTDNGILVSNVFNGTVWDDEAATAVTAATFEDNVTTTPLQPEGSLADFDGEDANGTWTLEITDDGTGDTGNLSLWSIDINDSAPAVLGIDLANPSPTDAATVDYTVTFSEAVTGVDPTDFALISTGIGDASITNVTGSDTTYIVTVNTGSGDGTLQLNLVDDDSIVDVDDGGLSLGTAGSAGAADGSFTGATYTIDKTAPVITFNPADTATNVPVANNIVITFNEAIRHLDDAEIINGQDPGFMDDYDDYMDLPIDDYDDYMDLPIDDYDDYMDLPMDDYDDYMDMGEETVDVASLITLKQTDASGADISFTATINAEKTQIIIDPDSNLDFSQSYYVELASVEDTLDNATTIENITFSTAAAPAPPAAPAPVVEQPAAPAPVVEQPAPTPVPAPAPVVEEPSPAPIPEVAEPSPGIFLDGGLLRIIFPDFPPANPENCGTEGDDLRMGNATDNLFCGLGGNDTLIGFAGADRLDGNNGDDEIFANTGNDSIDGGAGLDSIFAGQGDDAVNGGANFDVIMGDIGNDTIDGNAGNDVVFGNAGADVLDGDDGDDWVLGGQGDDIVIGGSGNDFIRGNLNNDILIGGAGGDRFDFRAGDGSDIISDFTDGQDIIGLFDGLTFADLTISQVGNDTQITATGLSITLQSVNSGAIDTNDFAII